MNLKWTAARLAQLQAMRQAGLSYEAAGLALGVSADSAKAAHKRHVAGRPDSANEAERSRQRRPALRAWEAGNDARNAQRRARRAKPKA